MGVYLERYKSGEHKAVWSELTALGDGIFKPDIYDDAVAVARETMKRVRYNVELLYERLIELKYEFQMPEIAFVKANLTERQKRLVDIEKILGKLPISVQIYFEEVGDVVFIGSHPLLAGSVKTRKGCDILSDPLMCYFWEFEPQYLNMFPQIGIPEYVEFSADDLIKGGYSGGASCKIRLADNPMDSVVYNLDDKNTKIYFIDYLRWVFHWGGFPGFERHLTENINVNYSWQPEWKFPLIELS